MIGARKKTTMTVLWAVILPAILTIFVTAQPAAPADPVKPANTVRRTPRVYFNESDTLDQESLEVKKAPRPAEETRRLTLEVQQKVLDNIENGLGGLDLRIPPMPDLPDTDYEFILPDTIYTTEITIGPNTIEYYDASGRRKTIAGSPVSPDAIFIWDPEGGRKLTTRSSSDIVRIGSEVIIHPGERIDGDVVSIAGRIRVEGEVKGDVVAIFGDIIVDGYVHGSVVAPFGKVIVNSTGRVRQDVVGSTIEQRPGSRIGGQRSFTHVSVPLGVETWDAIYGAMLVAHLASAVFLIFLILLAHVFAGRNIAALETYIGRSGFKSFVIGLLMELIGLPVLFLLLFITVIGIPVAVLVLPIAVVVAGILGYAAFGLRFGAKLAENSGLNITSQLGRTMAGVLAMLLIIFLGGALAWIPSAPFRVFGLFLFGVGHAIGFIAVTTGLGAVTLTRFGARGKTPAPNPDVEASSPPQTMADSTA